MERGAIGTQEIFMNPSRSEGTIGVDASGSEARRRQEQTDEDNVLVSTGLYMTCVNRGNTTQRRVR